jgi:GNAT superfamily N-acetyltransferase
MHTENYIDVPAGSFAAVVTHLEMKAAPDPRPILRNTELQVHRVAHPEVDWYRDLYSRIGLDWLWYTRLTLSTAQLEEIIHNPLVELFTVIRGTEHSAMIELDYRKAGECEVALFGVVKELIGTGAGRLLMEHALRRAWAKPIERVWVHTRSIDHPAALGFYIRSGFQPFKRQVEILSDPRTLGIAPLTAAPHVPLIVMDHP